MEARNKKKINTDIYLECGNRLLLEAETIYGFKSKMADRKAITYDIVDFFSGCGGTSYGFDAFGKRTGLFKHIAAFDIDKHANATFCRNFGHKPFDYDLGVSTIKKIKKAIFGAALNHKNPLIVIGCAPCQGFSSHRKKDDRTDSRNTLVGKFAEIAVQLNPEIIIMENVPDLLAEKHWHHYAAFQKILESKNYNITTEIINMAHYGVPQKRFRTLVIAAKNFVPVMPPPIFSKENFRTVRDAIGHLPSLKAGERSRNDEMHMTSKHRESTVSLLSKIPKDGGSRPVGLGPKCLDRVSGFYDVYGRLFWDKPAVTITAHCRTPSCGRFAHPEQNRGLSVREAALLQGFPANYYFEGPFDDKFKQIGNAVPPIFSVYLAVHIAMMLSGFNRDKRIIPTHLASPIAQLYSGVIAERKRGRINSKR